ncbi:MAG: sugar ABC transporter ATP-binding protein, partial [Anaerolineae bacterium]|nr:sugar ABC transporter ATP-binding protein [Anaerolineae bacterium]
MTTPTAPIIEFDGISKNFGGVHALSNVTFAVPRGEVHALVGENGAGKSTLIRICGGVFPADAGKIRFDGQEVAFDDPLESRSAGISIVHQEILVCPHLTAAENIFLGQPLPRTGGMIDWREVNRRAKKLFSDLEVDVRPGDVVSTLPIAKRQIIAIAQALSLNAKLVIMDEPTSALSQQEAA